MDKKADKRYLAKPGAMGSKYNPRYVIVDTETEEIVDDAQGYGYKSPQKAYAAWNYKNRSPAKKKEQKERQKIISEWAKRNKDFIGLMDQIAFEITKGSWGPDDKFDTALVNELLKGNGYTDLPFSAYELLRYWRSH